MPEQPLDAIQKHTDNLLKASDMVLGALFRIYLEGQLDVQMEGFDSAEQAVIAKWLEDVVRARDAGLIG